jgi:hypothetical protein
MITSIGVNTATSPVASTIISAPVSQTQATQTEADKTTTDTTGTETTKYATSTLVTNDGTVEKSVSIHGDSVEISSMGMTKAKNAGTSDAVSESKTATSESSSASSAIKLLTSEEDDDDDSVTDLTKYTDSDLSKLVADGKISNAQYIQEIERRKDSNNTQNKENEQNLINYNQ